MHSCCFALATAIALALPLLAQAAPGNTASRALVAEGNVLQGSLRLQDALEKYDLASKADPGASAPFAARAEAYRRLAIPNTWDFSKYVRYAQYYAYRAIELDENDEDALEILRAAAPDDHAPAHRPNARAKRYADQGRRWFLAQQFAKAGAHFRQAIAADPAWSRAWVGAAECLAAQGDWPRAQAHFRRATVAEPLNAMAWGRLSDLQRREGKDDEARKTLFLGLTNNPAYGPNWNRLARLWPQGTPLERFTPKANMQLTFDPANGSYSVDNSPIGAMASGDQAFFTPLLVAELTQMQTALTEPAPDPAPASAPLTLMQQRIAMLRDGIKAYLAKQADPQAELPHAPMLRAMRRFERDGQEDAAMLLLAFREDLRPELDAWARRHPNGVEAFVTRYHLRP